MKEYLVPIEHNVLEKQLKGIDYIYLINLDERKDRLGHVMKQLEKYRVVPQRVSAVEGKALPQEAFEKVGLKFESGMEEGNWVRDYSSDDEFIFLLPEHYGKTVFSKTNTKGAIGCTLSHLSVLYDAYERGYETIWVMEDDVLVVEDPHKLSKRIQELNKVTDGQWDLLYTDKDSWKEDEKVHFCLDDLLWRPDQANRDLAECYEREVVNDDFVRVGLRIWTTSMIISRSGMKKIIDYYEKFHIFLMIDLELSLIPNLRKYNLRNPIVTFSGEFATDIQIKPWTQLKYELLTTMPQNLDWRIRATADLLIEFIHEVKPQLAVEVVFISGIMSVPIAFALNYNKTGRLLIVPAFESKAITQGMQEALKRIGAMITNLLHNFNLEKCCSFFEKDAAKKIQDSSVDLLYFDMSTWGTFQELETYFPKVKSGGYIFFSDALQWANRNAVSFLMQRATWIKEKSLGLELICFQKH